MQKCISLNIEHAQEPCEWIIIDNNSNQETKNGLLKLKSEAEKRGHRFEIIYEPENTGVARAWNKGLRFASCEFICVLNNDAVMMPNWASLLISSAKKNKLDIFSPFILEKSFLKTYTLEQFLNGQENFNYYIRKNKERIRKGVFGGVIIFGKKEYFDEIGAFDEQLWLSMEDIDFLWRAHLKNLKIGVISDVVAFHYSSLTRNEVAFDNSKNQAIFEQKHGWNFEKNENSFSNKLIKSRNKRLLSYLGIMGTLNPYMPKNDVTKSS